MNHPIQQDRNRGWPCLAACVLQFLFAAAASDSALAAIPSVAEFVDPQGQLLIPRDYRGALDPKGFRMETGADGAPRFISTSAKNAPLWSSEFGGSPKGCSGPISTIVAAGPTAFYVGLW